MRAIVAYATRGRDINARTKLFKRAKIKPAKFKTWQDARNNPPTIGELSALALAAKIPQRFAERGFTDLAEFENPASQAARIINLESEVSRLVARDSRRELEERTQTAGTPPQAIPSQPPQRP